MSTEHNRYEAWCGTGWPAAWSEFLGDPPEGTVVWPIVDREAEHIIDGYPTKDQWFCVAFTPEDQDKIAKALNTNI